MLIKIWRFVTILLVALVLGLAFAHVLERPAKMIYDAALYLTIQKPLYFAWGPPNIGGMLEPAAIFATLMLAFFLRKQKVRFGSPSVQAAHCCLRFRSYFSFLLRQPMRSFSPRRQHQFRPIGWNPVQVGKRGTQFASCFN